MTQVYPVLLAGGSGTRLWPLSRKSYPKQFSTLIGEMTLFQSSAQRLTSSQTYLNLLRTLHLQTLTFVSLLGSNCKKLV